MKRLSRTLALRLVFPVAAVVLTSCIPASVSRIGPPRARRPKDCEVRVLPPGETPERPWVDIGVVHLENCQEYHVGMCRKWLMEKACELGGEVAYLPNPETPKESVHPVPIVPTNNEMRVSDPAAAVNFRVLVAVYAVGLTTPFPGEQGCKEPHPDPKLVTDTDTETTAIESGDTGNDVAARPPEKCME